MCKHAESQGDQNVGGRGPCTAGSKLHLGKISVPTHPTQLTRTGFAASLRTSGYKARSTAGASRIAFSEPSGQYQRSCCCRGTVLQQDLRIRERGPAAARFAWRGARRKACLEDFDGATGRGQHHASTTRWRCRCSGCGTNHECSLHRVNGRRGKQNGFGRMQRGSSYARRRRECCLRGAQTPPLCKRSRWRCDRGANLGGNQFWQWQLSGRSWWRVPTRISRESSRICWSSEAAFGGRCFESLNMWTVSWSFSYTV